MMMMMYGAKPQDASKEVGAKVNSRKTEYMNVFLPKCRANSEYWVASNSL